MSRSVLIKGKGTGHLCITFVIHHIKLASSYLPLPTHLRPWHQLGPDQAHSVLPCPLVKSQSRRCLNSRVSGQDRLILARAPNLSAEHTWRRVQ